MNDKKDDVSLDKGFIPYMSKILDMFNLNKIINMSILKLEAIPISDIRSELLNEVKEIKTSKSSSTIDQQLQKLFNKIFTIQPEFNGNKRDMKNTEQRLYADIISTPGFLDDEVVRDFILNRFKSSAANSTKYICLTKIIHLYDELSPESIDKFNYCYRSSSNFARALLYENRYFSRILNDRTLSMFNKETFSQIFRFANDYKVESVFSNYLFDDDDRALFILSQMCENIYNQVGHTSEFIDAIVNLAYDRLGVNFKNILIEYYDKVIGSKENEEAFKESIKNGMTFEMREIVNVMFNSAYSYVPYNDLLTSKSLEEFIEKVSSKREENHITIFGKDGFKKFMDGTFNPDKDFRDVLDMDALAYFKEAFLTNIYGISLRQADFIVTRYGENLDKLAKNLSDSDKEAFEILKSIVSITSLGLDNQDEIKVLQNVYLEYMREKGLNYQKKSNSCAILEGLFNRMYMNTYNAILFNDLSSREPIYVDEGVPLIDAGVEFNMIVTSMNGTSKYFQNGVNIASKWNTAFRDIGQGLCTSFINNQNLGVISLDGPLLGFGQLPQDSLNTMGTTDIYTYSNNFNLRLNNRKRTSFFVGSEMANQTRYGYNEMLVDRFLSTDSDGKVKVQPDYVVFYKTQDNYALSKRYAQTLKTAKEFGIPIVIVDYEKVQLHEKKVIKEMEDNLFSSDKVDEELLVAIMTRYMNNISGTRTIHGHPRLGGLGVPKNVNFPEKALGNFIDQIISKCETVSDDKAKKEWLDALQKAYDAETKKHMVAIGVRSYNCSIGNDNADFILISNYDLPARLNVLHAMYDETPKKEENLSFRKGEIPSEIDALTGLANYLDFNTTYVVSQEIDKEGKKGYSVTSKKGIEEPSLEEKLIVAYFTDNFDEDLISKIDDKSDIKFGTTKHVIFGTINKIPLVDNVEGSYLFEDLQKKGLNMRKINAFICKLDDMDDNKFLNLFGAHICKVAESESRSYEYIADKFLEKKANIRSEFENLNRVITNTDNEGKMVK